MFAALGVGVVAEIEIAPDWYSPPSPSYAFEGAADFVHDDQGGDGGDDGMLIMEMRSMNVVTGRRM